jgi:hypothetical protein
VAAMTQVCDIFVMYAYNLLHFAVMCDMHSNFAAYRILLCISRDHEHIYTKVCETFNI